MSVGSAVKSMGKSAKGKAEAVTHDLKDRALEKRLDRSHEEQERLRTENELLRDEVTEARSEHRRILDLLESRMEESEGKEKKSHKGRWLLFLTAIGGGIYYWFKKRNDADMMEEWGGPMGDRGSSAETGTAGL